MNVHDVNKWYTVKTFRLIFISALVALALLSFSYALKEELVDAYHNQFSIEIQDRNGNPIRRYTNKKEHYARRGAELPERFKELLLKKEDKFFYYHPGVNPASIVRAFVDYARDGTYGGSSTLTQQLVKVLLGNEQNRTVRNKLMELAYAASIEVHLSKEEILKMYAESVYLGNQAQGFFEASQLYFDKPLHELNDAEILGLLATISSPSVQNPWEKRNERLTATLAKNLDVELNAYAAPRNEPYHYQSFAFFELQSLGISCLETCRTTIDEPLTESLREILKRNIDYSYRRGARNGAIVVIKVPENELLAIVGSPDPRAASEGAQINMGLEPRPIGSTVKPFIYLKGFEKGLRPYTNVEDREYTYPIATGFPLYPKNFDGQYRGTVTLHKALSNSLNVPSVKVLEYIGLPEFYDFLENELTFSPIQNLEEYEFGIALGGLEMDLLTLAHFFSIFPNNGTLEPLKVIRDETTGVSTQSIPPQSTVTYARTITAPEYTQLVTTILNDRKTGVEQFGLVSNLNLTQDNYAVKTGTSRDFHDSWVVGFTPDFIVGVWLGNSENKPLEQLSGQSGAGRVWREAMELLFTTPHNLKTPFSFDDIVEMQIGNSLEYGLATDIYEDHVTLLEDDDLIISPHNGDTFELTARTSIPLEAKRHVAWFVNKSSIGQGIEVHLTLTDVGVYTIRAVAEDGRDEEVRITIVKDGSTERLP